jgi:hypothetical protein
MRIVNNCLDRALLLLQLARESQSPQFEAQATHLAHELLVLAAVRINSGRAEPPEKEIRAN